MMNLKSQNLRRMSQFDTEIKRHIGGEEFVLSERVLSVVFVIILRSAWRAYLSVSMLSFWLIKV